MAFWRQGWTEWVALYVGHGSCGAGVPLRWIRPAGEPDRDTWYVWEEAFTGSPPTHMYLLLSVNDLYRRALGTLNYL